MQGPWGRRGTGAWACTGQGSPLPPFLSPSRRVGGVPGRPEGLGWRGQAAGGQPSLHPSFFVIPQSFPLLSCGSRTGEGGEESRQRRPCGRV